MLKHIMPHIIKYTVKQCQLLFTNHVKCEFEAYHFLYKIKQLCVSDFLCRNVHEVVDLDNSCGTKSIHIDFL